MARSSFTVITAPGAYAGSMSTFPWTAVATGTSSGMQFTLTGAEIVIARNSGTATDASITLTSVDDEYNRQEHVVQTLTSGQYRVIGPMKRAGWMQTNGKFYLHSNSTKVQAVIIKVPGL